MENVNRIAAIVNREGNQDMIQYLIAPFNNIPGMWFQQEGSTAHTTGATTKKLTK